MISTFFNVLHGIEQKDVPLVVALEMAIFLGYDGQLKQDSVMEIELFQSTIDQLKNTKMSKIENALIWLFVKTWDAQGQHVLDEEDLWNFGGEDLEAAIMGIAFPRKEKDDRVRELNSLILGKFGGAVEFYEWAREIHEGVIESMPQKAATKLLAFSDSVSVANDRITGDASFIAFRAGGFENGSGGNKYFSHQTIGNNFGHTLTTKVIKNIKWNGKTQFTILEITLMAHTLLFLLQVFTHFMCLADTIRVMVSFIYTLMIC